LDEGVGQAMPLQKLLMEYSFQSFPALGSLGIPYFTEEQL
jgi:hypothetical protein